MLVLAQEAEKILRTPNARDKAHATRALAENWRKAVVEDQAQRGTASPPDHPARPSKPPLLAPRDMPKRKQGSATGRMALLHAIAHIELNAIDLHLDMLARFGHVAMPEGFAEDWMQAADDEAKHFLLLDECLKSHGLQYGDLPAHDGMWQAARDTQHDLPARLAVVPMVLEARGLDVTAPMIAGFERAGDKQAVEALKIIQHDEVAHVAYGSKWFHFLCGRQDHDPKQRFHHLVRTYFHAPLKPPFDEARRAEAGLPPDYYWPLAHEK